MKPSDIEAAWGVTLPGAFHRLDEMADWPAVQLPTGRVQWLNWPLLDDAEIVNLWALRSEWDIPPGLLPFMGDLHDIVCLDYRRGGEPPVVLLNDAREETVLFPSLAAFIDAKVAPEEKTPDLSGIIKDRAWLDF